MYKFVDKKEVKKYTNYCANKLNQLKQVLELEGIEIQVELIGSGAKKMVTRNGNGPFDLDYNLLIAKMPLMYERDLKGLKTLIREALDDIVGVYGSDSTSAITYNLHYPDKTRVKFGFDIGIIRMNRDNSFSRLINDKNRTCFGNNNYIWNQTPKSNGLIQKVEYLKKHGHWSAVRNTYLEKKNMYLKNQDNNHPSFNVYVETINEIHSKVSKGHGYLNGIWFSNNLSSTFTNISNNINITRNPFN